MSGYGSFVTVTEGNVYLDPMSKQIESNIAYVREFADTQKEELSVAINNLSDVVSTYTPTVRTFDTRITPIDRPSFPQRPTFGDLGLNTNWPTDIIENPNLTDYGDLDFDYVEPIAPSEVDPGANYSENTYSSQMWEALFTSVYNDILSNGTGLSDAVHAAIVAREQEARRLNQDRDFRKALNAVGASGFNLAAGPAAGLLAEFYANVQKSEDDALNALTIKDFDLATENKRFAITSGTDLEKMLQATFNEVNKRGLEAHNAAKQFIISAFQENVKLYLGKWEGVRARLEAMKTKVEAITAKNDGEVKVILGKAEVLKTRVEAITAENTGKVEARKGEVSVYATEVEAISKEYSALVEESRVTMEGVRLEIEAYLGEENLKLKAFSDKAALAKDIALGVANISSQGVASALGAINTTLSNSYNASESRDESWRFSAGIDENHTFEEEA